MAFAMNAVAMPQLRMMAQPRASMNAPRPALARAAPKALSAKRVATALRRSRAVVKCQAKPNVNAAALTTEQVSSPDFMWSPTDEYKKASLVSSREEYDAMYKKSIEDPSAFWGEIASEFHWEKEWDKSKALEFNMDVKAGKVDVKWFEGGTTNMCYNCVDRHVAEGNGDKVAFYWEGNAIGEDSTMTYSQVKDEVCKLANWLKAQGVKKGDRVILYAPMILELPIAMLACARIGAIHAVVFGGFSADALAQRMLGSEADVVITCSAVMRGTKSIGLKTIVDQAFEICKESDLGDGPSKCLIYDNARALPREECGFVEGRDMWYQDELKAMSTECDVEWVGAEDPLFTLYTSGSTGMPKGVVHTTGGYMVGSATTFKYVFDYQKDDVFWCTADCGWITGHSYLAYGPMLNGASQVVFEGVPSFPDAGRCWDVVDKYKVTQFYTAPTLVRALMGAGDEIPAKYDLSSLRVLGSVGEPINPEAWKWYHQEIGHGNCPIVDTYWQTETGAHLITPLPGAFGQRPGAASLPFFGVEPIIIDDKGNELEGECSGLLCIKSPWPSMMRTLWQDHERYETAYFSAYPGLYFTGDGARRDQDGYYWITGRVDDVINVSGHRIGTAEVESALVSHPLCAEAAVVGVEHPVKGQSIYAFVTLMNDVEYSADLKKELVTTVRSVIGPFAAPDAIHWAPGLPKTRSGKIMRRVLRKIASNEEDQLGDTSTLADPAVVDELISLKGQ